MKLILTILLFTFSSLIFSNEKELQEKINQSYPDLVIKSIQKTDFNDLYEILISDQIIYTNKDFSFLIVEGRVVDPETKIDITSFQDLIDQANKEKEIELKYDLERNVNLINSPAPMCNCHVWLLVSQNFQYSKLCKFPFQVRNS